MSSRKISSGMFTSMLSSEMLHELIATFSLRDSLNFSHQAPPKNVYLYLKTLNLRFFYFVASMLCLGFVSTIDLKLINIYELDSEI